MKQIYIIITGLLAFTCIPSVINAQTNTNSTSSEEEVYTIVEVAPEFPGGEEARMKFLRDNIVYPIEARKKGIKGRVVLSFIVEKNGSITNIEVLKSAHKLLDEEAIRVTKLMPAWKPAMQKDKPVSIKYSMPITFNIY